MQNNNFDIMRILAALLVLVSHVNSYSIQENYSFLENGGIIGLSVFFALSGYLITMSWQNSKHVESFTINRCLRIFPALWITIILTVFILGPLVSSLPTEEYFSHDQTYNYLKNNLILSTNLFLPGVFEEHGMAGFVNSPLWSVAAEFMLYMAILVLGLCRMLNLYVLIIIYILCLVSLEYFNLSTIASARIFCIAMFFSGAIICCAFKWNIKSKHKLSTFSFIVSLILIYFDLGYFAALPIAWLIISLAFVNTPYIDNFGKYGDYSYAIYLSHYPIIKTIISITEGNINLISLTMITILSSFIFAFISWHLIEKQALKFKKKPLRNIQKIL